ncbi:hypothetical protein GCM10023237_66200 [Streptomyces coeruleoprunus]
MLCASGVLLLVLLGTAGRYGYHRDELYFRLLGQHLAWGYTDVPVGTPALARLFTTLLGDNLFALRVPSALSAALTVVLTAALARELGGGRSAQTLAAAGTAAGGSPWSPATCCSPPWSTWRSGRRRSCALSGPWSAGTGDGGSPSAWCAGPAFSTST